MTPEELAAVAAQALSGGTWMTLVRPRGAKMPKQFPRGELLCENHDGSRVYSHDPAKVLAWMHASGCGL